MLPRPLTPAAVALGAMLAGPAGASAQALDPAALQRLGSTTGAVPSGAAVGQALRALRSGTSHSSLSSLGGSPLAVDTIGRPPLNDFTAYGGSGLSTGQGDYTREMGPSDLTRVATPITVPTTATLAQGVAGGTGRSPDLVPGSSGGRSGGADAGGGGAGGLGSLLSGSGGGASGLGSLLGR